MAILDWVLGTNKKQQSILTPEAQKRGASLPVSRGGTPKVDPFAGLKTSPKTTPTGPKIQPNIIDTKKDYGISFSADIANATLPKGKLTFQNGMFGTVGPSLIRGQEGAFTPLMAGTKQDKSAMPSSGTTGGTLSQGTSLADTNQAAPITSEASGVSSGVSSEGSSVGSGGASSAGGTPNTQGGGGYSPPGLGYMEEEQANIPESEISQSQTAFSQAPKGGALSAGGSSGSLAGGQPPSKYQQGFNQALAVMGTGGGMNVPGGQGASLVNQYSPTKRNDTSSMFVQSDPFINGLVTAWQDFINPQNQRKSLADTYNQMIKDSGIQAIDMELVDMKKVIEGTEDDIRTEITKAGGFATESQVLAMTNARNKQLIRNYNTLLDTRNAKEKYLNTAIQLEEADRQSADQRFESMFSMGTQLATMQQQIQQNARSQMQWLATNIGFDGLLEATDGDPFSMSLIESSLGLPQGGLVASANQARNARIQAAQEQALDLQLKQQQIKTPEERALETEYKREQIKTERAQQAKIYSDMKNSVNKPLTAEQSKALGFGSRLIQAGNIIDQIGDQFATKAAPNFSIFGFNLVPNFLKSEDQQKFEQAKRNFINAQLRRESGAVISPEEFKEADEQYFPKLGNPPEVLEQKRQNRILAQANLLREGGLEGIDPTKLQVSPTGELIEIID